MRIRPLLFAAALLVVPALHAENYSSCMKNCPGDRQQCLNCCVDQVLTASAACVAKCKDTSDACQAAAPSKCEKSRDRIKCERDEKNRCTHTATICQQDCMNRVEIPGGCKGTAAKTKKTKK